MKIDNIDFLEFSVNGRSHTEAVESFAEMVEQYKKDCTSAYHFAMNPDPEIQWGLIQVGCALANLTLIPIEQVSDKRSWFMRYLKRSDDSPIEDYLFLRANDYMRFL